MISVVMCAFNSEKTVRRAIESILAQTYKNFEFIILDDGSTDATRSIIEQYAETDDRIVAMQNEHNLGLQKSLNLCIDKAKYQFIARMDADDVSYPTRLQTEIDFLTKHAKFAFVGSNVDLTSSGKIWGERCYPTHPDKYDLARNNPYCHPSIMIRKSALLAVGGYTESKATYRCEDYDLYFKLQAKDFVGCNIQDKLIAYSEDPVCPAIKHSTRSRLAEFRTRLNGAKNTKTGFIGIIFALKPIVLIFLPKFVYNKIKRRKARRAQETKGI